MPKQKPKTKQEVAQYFKELAEKAGMPKDKAALIEQLFDHDDFAATVDREGIMTRSEFSRNMNEFQEAKQKWIKWYQEEALPTVKNAQTAQSRVEQYEKKFGKLEDVKDLGDGTGKTPSGDYVDMDKVQKLIDEKIQEGIQNANSFSIGTSTSIARAMFDYQHRFGKTLDPTELLKTAAEEGITVEKAYENLIAPDVEKQSAEAKQKEIDAAVKKALAEERMRKENPNPEADPSEQSPFYATRSMSKAGKSEGDAGKKADEPTDLTAIDAELESQFLSDFADIDLAELASQ